MIPKTELQTSPTMMPRMTSSAPIPMGASVPVARIDNCDNRGTSGGADCCPRAPKAEPRRRAGRRRRDLEVAAERLLALDRLEQRLEVAVAEAARAVPLDHLEEERRAVLRRSW